MNKYYVEFNARVGYEVEANNENEAEDEAGEKLSNDFIDWEMTECGEVTK